MRPGHEHQLDDRLPATRATLARELAQPWALGAIAVLVLNDHVLKGSGLLPGVVTGKLSDVAGLGFFPLLLFVLADGALWVLGARSQSVRRAVALLAPVVTAVGFGLVKLNPSVNAAVASLWGPMVMDATDLLTLPAVIPSALQLWRSTRAPTPRSLPPAWLRAVALLAAALASIATPRPEMRRNFPVWKVQTRHFELGCATVIPWASKSGKQGVGISLELSPTAARCALRFTAATLRVEPETVTAAHLPEPLELTAPTRVYLPFPFDNERAWNDDRRSATLQLSFRVNGKTEERSLHLHHVRRTPHVRERREPSFTPGVLPPPKKPQPWFATPPGEPQ